MAADTRKKRAKDKEGIKTLRRCSEVLPNGKTCQNVAVKDGEFCRQHSDAGQDIAATSSPLFVNGRYSKYLPARLMKKYHEAETDSELLSTRSEVALLHARIGELVERLHGGESGSLWHSLQETWDRFEKAAVDGDEDVQRQTLDGLRTLIKQGSTDEIQWKELADTIVIKTKVAGAEWKRLVDMRQIITAERAILFAGALLDIVLQHTPELDRRAAIAKDVKMLMDKSSTAVEEPRRVQKAALEAQREEITRQMMGE